MENVDIVTFIMFNKVFIRLMIYFVLVEGVILLFSWRFEGGVGWIDM